MKITEGTMVIFKAWCYAVVAFFTPFGVLYAKAAETGQAPSWLWIGATAIAAVIATANTLRAYFDGSNSRYEERMNGEFKVKPKPPTPAPTPTGEVKP